MLSLDGKSTDKCLKYRKNIYLIYEINQRTILNI